MKSNHHAWVYKPPSLYSDPPACRDDFARFLAWFAIVANMISATCIAMNTYSGMLIRRQVERIEAARAFTPEPPPVRMQHAHTIEEIEAALQKFGSDPWRVSDHGH